MPRVTSAVSGPAVPVSLRAKDGVLLAGRFRAAATATDRPTTGRAACVVVHGFSGSSGNTDVVRICAAFAGRGFDVLAPDLRGHGHSAGRSTAGADEVRDVAAAVAWLRERGHRFVAVLGWSMGGSAVVRHAGLGGDADAVVSVSAAGTWFERGTRPMRLVHWLFETRRGRLVTRLVLRTRAAAGAWDEAVPAAPADVAGAIAPRPLLVVHGDADKYFPVHHAESLAAAAPHAEVWIEPGMGHAEVATTAGLLDRIAAWLRAAERACDDDPRD